jgi:hypothetical protein
MYNGLEPDPLLDAQRGKSTRRGDWMQIYPSGIQFWPLDPRPEEIDISDIAHASSNQCRYGGHCRDFYSVAEHAYWVSVYAPEEWALEALLHDSAEGYVVDVPRPIKRHLGGYYEIERGIEIAIARRFQLQHPWPKEVMEIDNRILLDERDQLLKPSPAGIGDGWPDHLTPLGVKLACWEPHMARYMFVKRFGQLIARRNAVPEHRIKRQ